MAAPIPIETHAEKTRRGSRASPAAPAQDFGEVDGDVRMVEDSQDQADRGDRDQKPGEPDTAKGEGLQDGPYFGSDTGDDGTEDDRQAESKHCRPSWGNAAGKGCQEHDHDNADQRNVAPSRRREGRRWLPDARRHPEPCSTCAYRQEDRHDDDRKVDARTFGHEERSDDKGRRQEPSEGMKRRNPTIRWARTLDLRCHRRAEKCLGGQHGAEEEEGEDRGQHDLEQPAETAVDQDEPKRRRHVLNAVDRRYARNARTMRPDHRKENGSNTGDGERFAPKFPSQCQDRCAAEKKRPEMSIGEGALRADTAIDADAPKGKDTGAETKIRPLENRWPPAGPLSRRPPGHRGWR